MPRKILIIDSDTSILKTFNKELINHDYSAVTIDKEHSVFKQIEQEKPDIVLLDIHFPDSMDTDIAERLSKEEIPFIFISGSQDQTILKQSDSINALGFLLKPVNINQLIIEIETALHLHNERIQLDRRKENINITIDNNRKVSVAIGIIMERYHSNGAQAFEVIRSAARSKQCRILDISKKIIDEHEKTLSSISQAGCSDITNCDKKKSLSTNEILNEVIESIYA